MNRLAVLAACVVVLGACDKKGDAAKPGDAPAGDKPGAAPAAPAPKPVGLNDPANVPAVVELAKKALACKFENGSFDSSCPEYKAWDDEKKIYDDPKAELTLVAFLEDSDAKVRVLGAKKLDDVLGYIDDKAEADRALKAAETCKVPGETAELGYIVGRIKLDGMDLFPRIKALLNAKETTANMRVGILAKLLRTNPANDDAFALTKESITNPDFDSNVQRTALGAFSFSTKPERCDVYLENADHKDVDHAGDALSFLTRVDQKCEAHFDKALAKIEERQKAKTAKSSLFADALMRVCDAKTAAKAPQQKKAGALAKKFAEDKTNDGHMRAYAIEAAAKCDAKGAKAYLGKFKKETDPEIKDTVARLSKPAAKK